MPKWRCYENWCRKKEHISIKFRSTKILTQGPSSPLIFSFLHLISYKQSLPFFKKAEVIRCRRDLVSNSEDYILMIFYHEFGGAVETGLARRWQLSTPRQNSCENYTFNHQPFGLRREFAIFTSDNN